jgi:hypothetical protein
MNNKRKMKKKIKKQKKTKTSHLSFFSVEMGTHKLFCPDWHGTVILLISVSHCSWDDMCEATAPGYIFSTS